MDRRHPVIKFDPLLIAEFLQKRIVVSAVLFPGGKSNSNYKVKLDDGSIYVVRFYSRVSPDFEYYVMELVRDLVPVPDILYYNARCAVFSFLSGEPLSRFPQFADEAAKAIVRISSITFDFPGELKSDGNVVPWEFGGIGGFIEKNIVDPRVLHWIGKVRQKKLSKMLEMESERYTQMDAESCLVHGDFNPGNILIHEGKVSGILDWEFSHVGSPFMDIANLMRNLDPCYHDKIYAGLVFANRRPADDWRERAQLISLTSHLEFLTTDRSDSFKRKCVDEIDYFLANQFQG